MWPRGVPVYAALRVIEQVQRDGVCWLGASTFRGAAIMRVSVVGWNTTTADADRSAEAILDAFAQVRVAST